MRCSRLALNEQHDSTNVARVRFFRKSARDASALTNRLLIGSIDRNAAEQVKSRLELRGMPNRITLTRSLVGIDSAGSAYSVASYSIFVGPDDFEEARKLLVGFGPIEE